MANIFSFQLSEDFLTGYAAYLKLLHQTNQGKHFQVTIHCDLIPDGVGYEMSGPPQITVDKVKEEEQANDGH